MALVWGLGTESQNKPDPSFFFEESLIQTSVRSQFIRAHEYQSINELRAHVVRHQHPSSCIHIILHYIDGIFPTTGSGHADERHHHHHRCRWKSNVLVSLVWNSKYDWSDHVIGWYSAFLKMTIWVAAGSRIRWIASLHDCCIVDLFHSCVASVFYIVIFVALC